jgi:hypothetical protein
MVSVAIAIRVPVLMIIAIAMFDRFTTIIAPIFSLTIVITTIAVKIMAFGDHATPITIIAIRGLRAGDAREEEYPAQRRRSERCLAEQRLPETMQLHTSSLGASLMLVGVLCVLAL